MTDTVAGAAYWIREAGQAGVDPDQIATQNYGLPSDIHREVRSSQVSFLESLLREQAEPRHVLDLGCGPGVWAIQLAHMVDSWLGIDIAPKFIECAKREATKRGLTHLEFREGSMLEVAENRRFQVIILGGILGYVSDRDVRALMDICKTHLAPGGVVYTRVSTIPGIYPRLSLGRLYPITYRKQAEYERTFREAGFSVTTARDYAFTEAHLATVYTAPARWYGKTGMTAYRMALRFFPLTFGLARRLLDFTPLPRSSLFILHHAE